ncbi:hypothetical protein GCM10011504_42560 [Siccirubricoccus deserti]|uniref:Permease n=1 Tax=Siccirubricoccus deserti TaxID=2013562 RepID=A0A9X0R1A4_9PROT|nr:permease [Siccirubricoccus deserti]MBC4017460.1 permease [Siccirubricoccus deserti]GGC59854.1 hypothetical protein GCM10011504_42560 [Siccirubricoccus deserti]
MLNFLRRHSSILIISGIGLVAGALVWGLHGPVAFIGALGVAFDVFLMVLPAMLAGLLLAGSLKQLIPAGALAKWMGEESGWRGLMVASLCGMVMPGGPMAAFPLVLVLAQAGADRGALIAFVVAWALNGFQRVLVWEVPLLGADFALLRFLCGLPMPFIAGALARRVPIRWAPPGATLPAEGATSPHAAASRPRAGL